MREERAVVSHDRPSCAVFVQIPLMLDLRKNLGVVFRFVVSKQLVDVSTHVIFR